jgi:DNA-binding transcriptional regulator YiaG
MANTPCDYPASPEDVKLMTEGRSLAATGRGREIRVTARLSRGEVARMVGVSTTSVLRWERQWALPYGKHAVKYARLLRELAAEVAIHG